MFSIAEPIKPLPPQRFQIINISSDSVSFSWAPPFHSGGGEIEEYELTFEQSMIIYNQEVGQKNRKVSLIPVGGSIRFNEFAYI